MSQSLGAKRAPLGTLKPGKISPRRAVPAHIDRPEYMYHSGPEVVTAGDIKSPETIEKIRVAGRIMGFPKSLCTSINEVICHGIPDDRPLEDGDIVNVDITAYYDGVHGDTCAMFEVGNVDEESHLLIERTRNAMMRGIKAVRPGREINVIGRVIESYAHRFDYGVVRDFTGHGVGEAFHSGLIVPHYDAAPAHNEVMEEGMVFTIEPMLNLGGIEWEQWDDDWTVVTKDRGRSAQFEHTIVVTEDGAEILTLP